MKSQFFLFFSCLLCMTFCAASEPSSLMTQRLTSLDEGSRILYELPQSIVSIYVSKKSPTELILDVASATKDVLERENMSSWLEWSHKNTPSATLKEKIIIHLPEGTITQTGHSSNYAWLVTLLSLKATKVPLSFRKKAGPTPMPGELDNRPLWHPKIVVQGKKLASESSVYKIIWPADGSFLEQREILLYFPESPLAVKAFPYWIESPSSSYKIFVVDSEKASP